MKERKISASVVLRDAPKCQERLFFILGQQYVLG